MSRRLLIVLSGIVVLGLAGLAVIFFLRSSAPPARPVQGQILALGQFIIPPQSARATGKLRLELLEALGLGGTPPWSRRTDLIRGLPALDLTAAEVEALLIAMMESCPPHVNQGVHSTYMHEIAGKLQLRPDTREPFARALATLARDTGRDGATRDYSVQHLRLVWARAAADPALRASIVATFREFTGLDPAVAVSGLLSLHLLGSLDVQRAAEGQDPLPGARVISMPAFFIPNSDLAPFLDAILATKNPRENLTARLTALRIIGERRMKDYRPLLLKTLNDRSEHTLLRMAAVGALGSIANPEDLKILAAMDPGDKRVATALRHALRPGVGH